MKIKSTYLLYGFPISTILILLFLWFIVTYFFGHEFEFSLACIALLLIYKRYIQKTRLILKLHSMPLSPEAAIRGLSKSHLSYINELINSNKKVLIGLPRDWIIRRALSKYIQDRCGAFEIKDSGELVIGETNLRHSIVTIYNSDKEQFLKQIEKLTNKGWVKNSNIMTSVAGFSLRYTCEMIYNP
ncbi:hypothetical protein [Thalassotalea marina]|uniref:hypothetical protein n=1 Tax=Thalassotalea marina TaxID=1673741 RepID=UPI0016748108|nr:hypothetical protein [Thalassotalea marina]